MECVHRFAAAMILGALHWLETAPFIAFRQPGVKALRRRIRICESQWTKSNFAWLMQPSDDCIGMESLAVVVDLKPGDIRARAHDLWQRRQQRLKQLRRPDSLRRIDRLFTGGQERMFIPLRLEISNDNENACDSMFACL